MHDSVYNHYRTEQKTQFTDPGPQQRDAAFTIHQASRVYLGNDRPEMISKTHATFKRLDTKCMLSLRAAGAGRLVQTSVWHKPVKCNTVTGGTPISDQFYSAPAIRRSFARHSDTCSVVSFNESERDPILGGQFSARANVHLLMGSDTLMPPFRRPRT